MPGANAGAHRRKGDGFYKKCLAHAKRLVRQPVSSVHYDSLQGHHRVSMKLTIFDKKTSTLNLMLFVPKGPALQLRCAAGQNGSQPSKQKRLVD